MIRSFLFIALASLSSLALQPLKLDKVKKYVKAGAKNESACFVNFRDSASCSSGTGVLIAPRYVLTCAHVVPQSKPGATFVPQGRVTFETDLKGRSNSFDGYRIELVTISPRFHSGTGGDLALLRLEKPVREIRPSTFINVEGYKQFQKSVTTSLPQGHLTAWGYGGNSAGKDFMRLGGEYHSASIDSKYIFVYFMKTGKIPAIMMPGDSGGPIYYKGKLLGLNQTIHFSNASAGHKLMIDRNYKKLTDHISHAYATPLVDLKTGKLRADLLEMMKTLGLKDKEIKKIVKKK